LFLEAPLPSVASVFEGTGPSQPALSQAMDQAIVVGADGISFVLGVTAEQRQNLID
jgi:hypothetical protein